ncbi:MAG TPA: heavy metal translocating P-type ATPase [Gemmatimonadales bacterium]|jgi:Cd2+/Zn2+-exporting ATPase
MRASSHLFRVSGIDCPSCAAPIARALEGRPGVSAVTVDVLKGEVRVAVGPGAPSRETLAAAITAAGFPVREAQAASPAVSRGPLVAAGFSGLALLAGLILTWTGTLPLLVRPFLLTALVAGGWYVAPRGWRSIRSRALDMHALMSIAAVGAMLIGEWAEAASAMFLFAVARLLEEWAVGRARGAIAALMELSPTEATVVTSAGDVVRPVGGVAVGEVIRIRPGDRVPLDGVILTGHSAQDESPITGESLPVDKQPGDPVYAGAINRVGALEVRSTAPASDTTLARILHRVEEAQASRAPMQSLVDRFAKVYTPTVVGLAGLVAILPPLLGAGEFGTWLYRALTLLVIACPCALVISTPVTIVSALAGAARSGVLVKGGAQLEALARITVVAFDKTGTLTEGRPSVTDMVSLEGADEARVLALAAAVERDSEHPVGRAIVAAALERGLAPPQPSGFTALPGRGARAVVGGESLLLGNRRLCDETGACRDGAHALMDRFEAEGKTAILLARGEAPEPLGVVAVADRVRPQAAAAVAALRDTGVRRVVLLTGDSSAVARAVGRAVGVDEIRSRLLPEDKHAAVLALQAGGDRVLVVGDGVNDAPALAAATVGVAMGAAGTHVALETADVALMGDDLALLAPSIQRARHTLRLIRQNIAVALGLKGLFLALAVLGQATLWMAVAADMGASLLVIGNGLRALRWRQS